MSIATNATETRTYVVGSNMPGYLPDSEPYELVGTLDDAKGALCSDLEDLADCATEEDDGDTAMEAYEAIALVRSWRVPDSIRVGRYVYWITEAE